MTDGLTLDSITKKGSMSIADKLKAKREAEDSQIKSQIVEASDNSYAGDPDVLATHALDLYRSYKGEEEGCSRFIEYLEDGKILLPYGVREDEELANAILIKLIAIEAPKVEEEEAAIYKEYIKSDDIQLENKDLHLAHAYEQKVHDAIERHADELLADSVTMFAEAMNFDPRFCDIIVRGDTQFYNQIEEMGFPMLALMVKTIHSNRNGE